MKLHDLQVLVIGGNGHWAKADTIEAARKGAFNPKEYIAYIVHPDTRVDDGGGLLYPSGQTPKQISRHFKKRTVAE